MATQLPEQQRVAAIAEANRRAIANGTSVTAELSKYADSVGLSKSDAEVMMGYPVGTLGGTPAAAPAAKAPNQWDTVLNTIRTAAAGATPNLGIGSNMVVSGAGNQAAYNSPATPGTPYKLDEATRAGVIAEAQRRAKESGRSAEQELYSYAQSQGASNSDLDTYMGMNPGASANFAKQNLGMGGIAAPQGNSYVGPATAVGVGTSVGAGGNQPVNLRAPDNRWSGDPTRQPDGSFNPQPSGNLGMGGNGDAGYQRNPYMDAMSRDMGSQMFDQWNRNVAPGLRSGAMATGGYGGSRQGVVEANSLNDLGRNYGQALTSMYGNDYTNYQNRGIQRQGQAQSYDLGLRNNDLGFANLDSNIYQNNFNNQLASAIFGLGVQNQLNTNNATGVAAGTQINNAPWDYQKYLNSAGNQAGSGWNTSTTTKTGG